MREGESEEENIRRNEARIRAELNFKDGQTLSDKFFRDVELEGKKKKTNDEVVEMIKRDQEKEMNTKKVMNIVYDKKDKYFGTNKFEEFLFHYIQLTVTMIEVITDGKYQLCSNIEPFDLLTEFGDEIPTQLNEEYRTLKEYVVRNPFRAIYDFAKFIITADSLLLYNNDKDMESVYTVYESEDSIKFIILSDDYNIGYYFSKDFAKDNKSKGSLEEYLDTDKAFTPMVGYVEVKHNTGNKSKTGFSFDLNGNYKTNGIVEEVLFNTIKNNTIETILNLYADIINRAIPIYTGRRSSSFDIIVYEK
jgi:hypothetical protein